MTLVLPQPTDKLNQVGTHSKLHRIFAAYSEAPDQSVLVNADGSVRMNNGAYVGAATKDASAAFQVDSTSQGLAIPRMTTAQRNAIALPIDGLIIYNSSTGKFTVRQSGAWVEMGSGGGGGAVTSVGASQPAAGITISGSPITTSGTLTFSLANDLAALEGLGSTGFAVRSASDTWVQRTILGTSNRITLSNGSGVSADPVIDISSSYVGQSSITTVSSTTGITTGVWKATVIDGTYINYNATNLKVTSTQLNTIQDIATSSTPQFARIGIGTAAGATTEETILQPVRTTGSPTMITWTSGAHTTLATTAEATVANFNFSASVQWATGTVALQRTMRIQGQTITAVGASTFTSVQTLSIGLPVAGTNVTFTNSYGLVVGAPTDFINTVANFGGSLNGFYEISMQNTSNGTLASSDVVAASDNATNGTNFVDMGITSSGFTDSAYTAWGGANGAYLFAEAASLNIATQRASAPINWFTGGTLTANKRMSLSGTAAILTLGVAGTLLGQLALAGNTSGTATIVPTAAAGSVTITLPAVTGTVILDAGTQTLSGNKTFSGTTSTGRIDLARSSLGTTSVTGLTVFNLTSASGGTPVQVSPWIGWQGTAWTGSASQTVAFYSYAKGVNGTTPVTGNLIFGSNINGAGNVDSLYLSDTGKLGIGAAATKAYLEIKAGTTTIAPLVLTSGTNNTTAQAGAIEYDGTNLFFTRAGTTRENVLVAVDNAAAPGTSVGVGIVNYYGSSATNFLGTPNRWMSINILGTVYKVPMYT